MKALNRATGSVRPPRSTSAQDNEEAEGGEQGHRWPGRARRPAAAAVRERGHGPRAPVSDLDIFALSVRGDRVRERVGAGVSDAAVTVYDRVNTGPAVVGRGAHRGVDRGAEVGPNGGVALGINSGVGLRINAGVGLRINAGVGLGTNAGVALRIDTEVGRQGGVRDLTDSKLEGLAERTEGGAVVRSRPESVHAVREGLIGDPLERVDFPALRDHREALDIVYALLIDPDLEPVGQRVAVRVRRCGDLEGGLR